MTQTCRPAKCIEAMRVTLLDQCTLEPVCDGPYSYAFGCIIDPNWTPEIEEGEESVVKDNCGQICLRDDRCDLTKRWNIEFKIKEPDKELLALIEGNPLVVDGGGDSVGVRHLSYGACTPYLFVEMWERTDACDGDGDAVYYRHVFPAARLRWTGNEREGVFRILQLEGKTREVVTDSIGTGPFDDIPAGVIVGASPTEKVDYVWFEDDFIPELQCGAIDVPCPILGPGFFLTLLEGAFDGSLGVSGVGNDVAVDSVGRYLVSTTVEDAANTRFAAVWRFNADGTPDVTFGTNGLAVVGNTAPAVGDSHGHAVAVDQSDDSVYVWVNSPAGVGTQQLVKLDSTGAFDVTWDGDGFKTVTTWQQGAIVRSMFVESTGDIVVFSAFAAGPFTAVIRYTPGEVNDWNVAAAPAFAYGVGRVADGTYLTWVPAGSGGPDLVEMDFAGGMTSHPNAADVRSDGNSGVTGITVDPVSGDVYVCGSNPAQTAMVVAKFDSSYVLDPTFGVGGVATITDAGWVANCGAAQVVVLPGGDIILSGSSATGAFNARMTTVRLDSTGALVPTYGTGGIEYHDLPPAVYEFEYARDAILDAGGTKLVHVGTYQDDASSVFLAFIARTLASTGAFDTSFG